MAFYLHDRIEVDLGARQIHLQVIVDVKNGFYRPAKLNLRTHITLVRPND